MTLSLNSLQIFVSGIEPIRSSLQGERSHLSGTIKRTERNSTDIFVRKECKGKMHFQYRCKLTHIMCSWHSFFNWLLLFARLQCARTSELCKESIIKLLFCCITALHKNFNYWIVVASIYLYVNYFFVTITKTTHMLCLFTIACMRVLVSFA